jgi:hypothetical protein
VAAGWVPTDNPLPSDSTVNITEGDLDGEAPDTFLKTPPRIGSSYFKIYEANIFG